MDEFGSPIAGGLRGIRRSVSSGVFTGRAVPPPQPDRQTTNLLSQNSLALGSLTRQVNSVTAQVGALSKALEGVQQSLALNDRLERQREAARQRREAQLAEQGLREGKESAIEQKIQSALLKPVQAIATRAQGILGRVGKFLFAIAAGWLTDKMLKFFSLKSEGNAAELKKFKTRFLSDLLLATGIITLFTGGIGKLVVAAKGLGLAFTALTFGAFLRLPFLLLFNWIGQSLNKFRQLISGALNITDVDEEREKSALVKNIETTAEGAIGANVLFAPLARTIAKRTGIAQKVFEKFPRFAAGTNASLKFISSNPFFAIAQSVLSVADFLDRKAQGETNKQALLGAGSKLATYATIFGLGNLAGGPVAGAIALGASLFIPDQVAALVDQFTGAKETRKKKLEEDKKKKNELEIKKKEEETKKNFKSVDISSTGSTTTPISDLITPVNKNVNVAQNVSNLDDSPQFVNFPISTVSKGSEGSEVAGSSSKPSQKLRDLAVRNSENMSIFTSGALYNMTMEA
tara:strand:- start:3050 stop:4603 length:1554 start_codon:yes stop_codon:yes gene_type:complete